MKPLSMASKTPQFLEVSRHIYTSLLRTWRFLFTNCRRETEGPGELCYSIQQDMTLTEQPLSKMQIELLTASQWLA